jgi:hypothetical protein
MLTQLRNFIENKAQNIVRRSILDWPLDFGVETAVLNNVTGDYHEFGVFEGRSFIRNAKHFKRLLKHDAFKDMKFWAYDSFEGLPDTNDPYAPDHFVKGAYSASEDLFLSNVRKTGISGDQIETVPGFYDQSLTDEQAKRIFSGRKIAMTYIDCDLYESCVPIFDFLTAGLQIGTVIVIDDWVRHHMHPNHGVQRALNEWLQENPSIKLAQLALSKRMAFVVYEL